jgi:hypothetical protein
MPWPESGLYRTSRALAGHEKDIPAESLVYIGRKGAQRFVVRPHDNRLNRWYWHDPVVSLTDEAWCSTLVTLPVEGFYTLPEEIAFSGGGRWLKNAIVQLGYNEDGRPIIFIAERHEGTKENSLHFSDRGMLIDDSLMVRLVWAPILPTGPAGEDLDDAERRVTRGVVN